MHSRILTAVGSAVAANNDALTWWLASAGTVALLLTLTAAVLVATHQRREKAPAPHYRRHSSTGAPLGRVKHR